MSGRGGHHGGKRERGQQTPFQGRIRRWRRQWVAAKTTKIGVTLVKWMHTAEVAAERVGPRNTVPILAADARPPLPKLLRKLPEAVPPRQRSTRVRMIGPGGYAELEMDDVALEGGTMPVAPAVHWSQQQAVHAGGVAPLAPVVGPAGFPGNSVPQSLQTPMMGGLNGVPPQPVGSGTVGPPAQTALQSAQYVVSNPIPLDRPAIAQVIQQGPRFNSLEQQQSAPVSSQQGPASSWMLDPEIQARLVQQAQAAQAVVTGSDSDVKG